MSRTRLDLLQVNPESGCSGLLQRGLVPESRGVNPPAKMPWAHIDEIYLTVCRAGYLQLMTGPYADSARGRYQVPLQSAESAAPEEM